MAIVFHGLDHKPTCCYECPMYSYERDICCAYGPFDNENWKRRRGDRIKGETWDYYEDAE